MLEPLGLLGGYIVRLFASMFIWQRMAANGYWFWGIVVLIGISFVGFFGSGFWQLMWLLALGILELTIVAFGLLEYFGRGRS